MTITSRRLAALLFISQVVVLGAQSPPTRSNVRTDDGFGLVVWSKRPVGVPRGELILLHGRTWSALPNFDLQVTGRNVSLMDAFVAEGFAVYAVDQRGYGATPRDRTGWLTPDRAARDAQNVADWVASQAPNHRRPAMLGYSRGSMTAMLAAQRHHGLLAALVLYGFAHDITAVLEAEKEPARPPREKTTAEGAGEDFITPDSTPAGVKEAYVRAALHYDPIRVDWRREHQWAELDSKLLHTPTLLINGERDPVAEAGNIPEFLARTTELDREWVVLAHSDHVAHLERQKAFVRAVSSFIDRVMHR